MRIAVRLPHQEASTESLTELLGRIAAIGFDGVAFADLDETYLRRAATALGETGLQPAAVQVAHDRLQAERDDVGRELATIGCDRVVVSGLHESHFGDESDVTRIATRLSALGGRLAAAGLTLCYRNGSQEFGVVEPANRDAYDLLAERSGDGLAFELDVGGVVAGGRDPVALLEQLDGRIPLVLLRDVDEDGEPVGLGEGSVDLAAVVAAARDTSAEWLVYGGTDYSARSLTRDAEVLASALE